MFPPAGLQMEPFPSVYPVARFFVLKATTAAQGKHAPTVDLAAARLGYALHFSGDTNGRLRRFPIK